LFILSFDQELFQGYEKAAEILTVSSEKLVFSSTGSDPLSHGDAVIACIQREILSEVNCGLIFASAFYQNPMVVEQQILQDEMTGCRLWREKYYILEKDMICSEIHLRIFAPSKCTRGEVLY